MPSSAHQPITATIERTILNDKAAAIRARLCQTLSLARPLAKRLCRNDGSPPPRLPAAQSAYCGGAGTEIRPALKTRSCRSLAVVLDLVNPLRPVGRLGDEGRETRLDGSGPFRRPIG